MATKVWTLAADFENETDTVYRDTGSVRLRDFGTDGFSATNHPDANETVNGFKYFKDANLSSGAISYSNGNAVITIEGADSAGHYYQYLAYAFGADKVTSESCNIVCDFNFSLASSGSIVIFGLMDSAKLNVGSGTDWTHGFRFQANADGSPQFAVLEDDGTSKYNNAGGSGTISDDTTYYGRLKAVSGVLSIGVYASDANRTAESSAVYSDSYDASGDSVVFDCFVIKNHLNASGTTQLTFSYLDIDAATQVTKSKGGYGSYFDLQWDTNFTYAIDNGCTGSIALSDGKLAFSLKNNDAQNKRVHALIATNSAIGKTSTYDETIMINFSSLGGGIGACGGFFKDGGNGTYDDSISFWVNSAGNPGLRVVDSTPNGAEANGSNGDISTSTDYWFRFRCSGGDITLDIYDSQADHDNDENQVRTLTLTQADLTTASVGAIACDRFGLHNYNNTDNTAAQTGTVSHFEGDGTAVTWWETCTARTTNFENGGDFFRTEYASLASTVTGTVTYKRRRKTTDVGAYTVDGSFRSLATVQTDADEDLYGFGILCDLDPSNTAVEISDVTLTYSVDDNPPEDMTNISSAKLEIFSQNHNLLSWTEPSDVGVAGLAFVEVRRTVNNLTFQYLNRSTPPGDANGEVPAWTSSQNDETGIYNGTYKFRLETGDDSSVQFRGQNFVDRNVGNTSWIYWARATDGSGNASGWLQMTSIDLEIPTPTPTPTAETENLNVVSLEI